MSGKSIHIGVDPRVSRTRVLLAEALMSLGAAQDIETIEIGDLVEEAGIARSTFYAHFAGKDDFLVRSFVNMIAATETAQDLLVHHRRRRAPEPVIDHETYRVRPDVDNRHRSKAQGAAFQVLDESHFRALTFFEMSPEISGGSRSLSELPRPDSDGLFMKYSWALNGSSPG